MEKPGVAVINGASRGIGKAIADSLKRTGNWVVVTTSRHEGDSDHSCDATLALEVAYTTMKILTQHHRIDLLVNVAGMFHAAAITDEDQYHLNQLIDNNFLSTWNWVKAVLPTMYFQGGGYIINISSMAAKRVRPGCTSYAMTKAAINSFTEGILRENLAYGIRATAICPGDTDTEIGRSIAPGEALLPTDDIARTVLWLLSLSKTAVVPEVCIERVGRWA